VERPMIQQTSGRLLAEEPRSEAGMTKATWRDYWVLTKPGINASNLMAVFTGFWLAGFQSFQFSLLLATLLGTALVIAGGCTVNNYIDRDIDPLMNRTRNRPVAAGRIQPSSALWMGALLGRSGDSGGPAFGDTSGGRFFCLRSYILRLDETDNDLEYSGWQYLRGHPTHDRLDGGARNIGLSRLGAVFVHVCLATGPFLRFGDDESR
jgi:hypothetical protein